MSNPTIANEVAGLSPDATASGPPMSLHEEPALEEMQEVVQEGAQNDAHEDVQGGTRGDAQGEAKAEPTPDTTTGRTVGDGNGQASGGDITVDAGAQGPTLATEVMPGPDVVDGAAQEAGDRTKDAWVDDSVTSGDTDANSGDSGDATLQEPVSPTPTVTLEEATALGAESRRSLRQLALEASAEVARQARLSREFDEDCRAFNETSNEPNAQGKAKASPDSAEAGKTVLTDAGTRTKLRKQAAEWHLGGLLQGGFNTSSPHQARQRQDVLQQPAPRRSSSPGATGRARSPTHALGGNNPVSSEPALGWTELLEDSEAMDSGDPRLDNVELDGEHEWEVAVDHGLDEFGDHISSGQGVFGNMPSNGSLPSHTSAVEDLYNIIGYGNIGPEPGTYTMGTGGGVADPVNLTRPGGGGTQSPLQIRPKPRRQQKQKRWVEDTTTSKPGDAGGQNAHHGGKAKKPVRAPKKAGKSKVTFDAGQAPGGGAGFQANVGGAGHKPGKHVEERRSRTTGRKPSGGKPRTGGRPKRAKPMSIPNKGNSHHSFMTLIAMASALTPSTTFEVLEREQNSYDTDGYRSERNQGAALLAMNRAASSEKESAAANVARARTAQESASQSQAGSRRK